MNLSRVFFLAFILFVSCGGGSGPEKEPVKSSGPTENESNIIKEGSYSFDSSKTKIIWNGFKTTDKIKVTGQFEKFVSSREKLNYNSLEELVNGLDFSISTSSSVSGDAVRDMNLKDYFFKLLTDKFTLSGTLGLPKEGLIPVTFNTLLGSKTVDLNFSFEKNIVEIRGVIDIGLDLGGILAYDSIHEKCEQLHTGGDGVSKTWSEVEVLVKVPIIRN